MDIPQMIRPVEKGMMGSASKGSNARSDRAHRIVVRVLVGSCLTLAACATAGTGGGSNGGDADMIVREEMESGSYESLFNAVETLRPAWLRTRPATTFRLPTRERLDGTLESYAPNETVVYLDNVRLGGIDSLHTLQVEQIDFVERLRPIDATQAWGTDHPAGAIHVRTRRQ
ncbi:MAG: hypothetical protein WD737_09250 [Gemmatimonadota bacterium]